ncbi:hypothetical protein [Arcobacter defluvii]|nr:hypothetical protein [Arcobacter defluvii]RXI33945.1 hypothetical protein CP964_03660 [Arcobacter defluvii]
MKNNFLPEKFISAHDLCFFIHDLLVNTLVSGENQDIFDYEFSLDEKITNNLENDEDILLFLHENKFYKHRDKVLKTIILPALLSDTLHCIYEALNSSKKAKLNITYMLIRKPIQESLYLLESMLISETEFGKSIANNPLELRPSITMKKTGIKGHEERINIVLDKLELTSLFSFSYLANLRYNKRCEDNFDGICNHAMHLFTEHDAIKTDKFNINFIFSDDNSKLTQWAYLYSRLPYILLYIYYIVEYLMEEICPTEKWYIEEMELRIFAHFILWFEDLDEVYYSDELLKIIEFSRNKLNTFCINNLKKPFDKLIIENIANNGISDYKDNK